MYRGPGQTATLEGSALTSPTTALELDWIRVVDALEWLTAFWAVCFPLVFKHPTDFRVDVTIFTFVRVGWH